MKKSTLFSLILILALGLLAADCLAFPVTPINQYRVFLSGDAQTVENLKLTADNIIGADPSGVYRVLVVPVNYPSDYLDQRLSEVAQKSEAIYHSYSLNVGFAYLNQNVPIPIYEDNQRIVTCCRVGTNDEQLVTEFQNYLERNSVYSPHAIIFLLYEPNSRSSATVNRFLTVIGESFTWQYSVVHEVAHSLNLNDGYFDSYSVSEIEAGRHSEYFFSFDSLPPERQQYLLDYNLTLVPTDKTAGGQPLFSLKDEETTVMNQGVYELHFNPYQLSIMRQTIERVLAQKP